MSENELYVNAGCVDTLVDAIQRVASSPALANSFCSRFVECIEVKIWSEGQSAERDIEGVNYLL